MLAKSVARVNPTLSRQASEVRGNGLLLWRGPSLFTREAVAVVLTGLIRPSENRDTGPLLQTFILPWDASPSEAMRDGADGLVCGDCPLRSSVCHVVVNQSPQAVWHRLRAGGYPEWRGEHNGLLWRRKVRLGFYGDPCAVPAGLWRDLLLAVSGARSWRDWLDVRPAMHVGYTHAWHLRRCQPYRQFLMASVESEAGRFQARSLGWKTFRIRKHADPLLPGEFECPKSPLAGGRLQCFDCMACRGGPVGDRATPSIVVHGSPNKVAHFEKGEWQ